MGTIRTLLGWAALVLSVGTLLAAKHSGAGGSREAEPDPRALTEPKVPAPLAGSSEEQRLLAHLRDAQDSVFLVALENDAAKLREVGTAWAVDEHRVATNAHVAEVFEIAQASGARLVVRHTGRNENYAVSGVAIHPGYEAWRMLERGGILRAGYDGIESLDFIAVCDVALLEIEGTVRPLRLATSQALCGASAGALVGYVGFPGEHVAGSRLNAPPATVVGHVTEVTDFFFQHAGSAAAFLLHHDLRVAGGASGSPILNSEGEVIGLVSAASMVALDNEQADGQTRRVRIPVGFNFGQRVDLLRELWDGSAPAAQQLRDPLWLRQLNRITGGPRQRIQDAADAMLRHWIDQGVLPSDASLRVVHEATDNLRPGPEDAFRCTIQFAEPGVYGFFATAEDWSDVDLAVTVGERILGADTADDGLPIVWLEFDSSDDVTVDVLAPFTRTDQPTVHLLVFRIDS
jgi:hypothetical protein